MVELDSIISLLLDHLPMGSRVFEEHVEAGRIGNAVVSELTISAPQLNTALVLGIEDPRIEKTIWLFYFHDFI